MVYRANETRDGGGRGSSSLPNELWQPCTAAGQLRCPNATLCGIPWRASGIFRSCQTPNHTRRASEDPCEGAVHLQPSCYLQQRALRSDGTVEVPELPASNQFSPCLTSPIGRLLQNRSVRS